MRYETSTVGKNPGWLRRKWGDLWDGVMRLCMDLIQDGARQAIACRFPLFAPVDALPYLGRERMIEQGWVWEGLGFETVWAAESAGAYRLRLDAAWTTWGIDPDTGAGGGGTPAGIARALMDYFALSNVEVYSLNADGWDSDGNTTNWSRFWVVIGQPNPWAVWEFGPDITFGPDLLFGTTMTATHYRAALRHLHRWRDPRVLPVEIVILQDGSSDAPEDVLASPALRYVLPAVALRCGNFFGYPGFEIFGGQTFGYYPIPALGE